MMSLHRGGCTCTVPKSHLEASPSPSRPSFRGNPLPPNRLASLRLSQCLCTSSATLPESWGPARKGCCSSALADGRSEGSCALFSRFVTQHDPV